MIGKHCLLKIVSLKQVTTLFVVRFINDISEIDIVLSNWTITYVSCCCIKRTSSASEYSFSTLTAG